MSAPPALWVLLAQLSHLVFSPFEQTVTNPDPTGQESQGIQADFAMFETVFFSHS
jgi:hypothetical protein